MFDSKKKELWKTDIKVKTSGKTTNSFINSGMKKTGEVRSENGARKYKSTGDDFVDQFAKIGTYKKPRSYNEISKDMELLYSQNKQLTMAFTLYLRLITRNTVILGNKLSVQYGAGLKHESIMRMFWLEQRNTNAFYKNLIVFVSAGSWKDIFKMLQTDLVYNGWEGRVLDWNKMGKIIVSGLNTESQTNLIKKYLPQIKAKSKCKTVEAQANVIIAKWICSLVFGNKEAERSTYKRYRQLKTSGNAHEWQKLISQQKFNLIDFEKVHGRALWKLVNSKFLENNGLKEKYDKFIENPEVDSVKFTGYVHELFSNSFKNDMTRRQTIDKQFNQLVKQAKDNEKYSNMIVVRDTSGSMGWDTVDSNMTPNEIAKSLALYMSEFLSGSFKNNWIEFADGATMHEWKGETVTDKWINDNTTAYGSTNFQSVIDLFCDLKRNNYATEEDFPTGIICLSDGEFNRSDLNETNVESARKKLANAGFSKEYCENFVIVLWNIHRGQSFKSETYGNAKNTFYYSGFDTSTIALLTGKIKTARELFDEAMNQQVMHYLQH